MLRGVLFISLLLQAAGWIGVSGFVYRRATPDAAIKGDVRDLRTMTGFERGPRSAAVTNTQLGGHSAVSHSLVRPDKGASRSAGKEVFGGRSKEDPPVVQNSNLPYVKPEGEGAQMEDRTSRLLPGQRVRRDLERQVQPRSGVDDLVQPRPFNRDYHASPSPVQGRQIATFLGAKCCKKSSKENTTVVEVKAGPDPETKREVFAESPECSYTIVEESEYPESEASVHASRRNSMYNVEDARKEEQNSKEDNVEPQIASTSPVKTFSARDVKDTAPGSDNDNEETVVTPPDDILK
ncbi:hypothetical protein SprV_0802462900 [Sparganum proliferum]